ncbi:Delta(6)-protoilludene synthase [Sparassis crispa]|uniref:Terpene synthase n=1 Tax=Sparassis crispa TaxID=139825 RepID=A0A401GA22_9APHY|nr:Delta(6)-protoilludene synthase [Sparassis crispa]GBE78983.1 Delta(6)-protoilludene synthase [Sparassis crispa]
MSVQFRLPETLNNWPWPRDINPYYEEVKAESAVWFRSFQAFSPERQSAFDRCDFSLLASLAYPTASREHLRTGCDIMNLFFVFDEYTDQEDAKEVKVLADIVIDAMHNPHKPRPDGENILGEISRQFWELAIVTASPTSQRRIIDKFTCFTASVVEQAEDRERNYKRSIADYLNIRRKTIGAEPSYAILELGMDLPDEMFYHLIVVRLSAVTTDLIIVGNDLCSFNKEQAMGDDLHNIISIVMHDLHIDLDAAMLWVEAFHRELVDHFFECWAEVKELTWSAEVDTYATEYLRGLANWVRANDCWNFESGRYFGRKGKEIQIYRMVTLLPR